MESKNTREHDACLCMICVLRSALTQNLAVSFDAASRHGSRTEYSKIFRSLYERVYDAA